MMNLFCKKKNIIMDVWHGFKYTFVESLLIEVIFLP